MENFDITKDNLLGIDPSLTATGISIQYKKDTEIRLIETKKDPDTTAPTIDYTKRIMRIKKDIKKICEAYSIKYACIEGMAYAAKGRSVFDLGGLSHMIREIFFELNISFIVVPPTILKKFWTGKGNANKMDMITETKKREINIPFTKKYRKGVEDIDDNCNDAFVCLVFLIKLLDNTLPEEFLGKIEKSW